MIAVASVSGIQNGRAYIVSRSATETRLIKGQPGQDHEPATGAGPLTHEAALGSDEEGGGPAHAEDEEIQHGHQQDRIRHIRFLRFVACAT